MAATNGSAQWLLVSETSLWVSVFMEVLQLLRDGTSFRAEHHVLWGLFVELSHFIQLH